MESVREKIAYVRGLIDSQRAQLEASGSLRLWEALLDTLQSVDDELASLDEAIDDQQEYMTAIDEDLMDLEDVVYGIEDEDHAEDDDDYSSDLDVDDDDDDTDDTVVEIDTDGDANVTLAQDGRGATTDSHPTFVAVECPHCHARLFVEEGLLDEANVQVSCPECEHPVYTGEAYHEIGTVARNGKV